MRFTIKIFFTIIMSLFVVLATSNSSIFTTEVSSEIMSCDGMKLESCCSQEKESTEKPNHCPCPENSNNKCGDTCSTTCDCGVNFFIFNEEIQKYTFLPLRIHSISIDTYSEKYAYLFQSDIYKPPMKFFI